MVAPLVLAGLGLLGGFANQRLQKNKALEKQSGQGSMLANLLRIQNPSSKNIGSLLGNSSTSDPFDIDSSLLLDVPENADNLAVGENGQPMINGMNVSMPRLEQPLSIAPDDGSGAGLSDFNIPQQSTTRQISPQQLNKLETLAKRGDTFAINTLQELINKELNIGDEGTREKQVRIESQNKELEELYKEGMETGNYTNMLAKMSLMGGKDKAEFLKEVLQPPEFTADGKFKISYDPNTGKQTGVELTPAHKEAKKLEQQIASSKVSDTQQGREDTKFTHMASAVQSANVINQMIQDLQDNKIYDASLLGGVGLFIANGFEMMKAGGKEKARRTASFDQQITTQAAQLLALQTGTKTDFDFEKAMEEVGNAKTKDQRIEQLRNLHARLINNYNNSVRQLQQGRKTRGQKTFTEEDLQGLTNVLKQLPPKDVDIGDTINNGQIVIRKKPDVAS
jgi:hypothetical protein|tara:strand:+ start:2074 stop:3429 length:1356 start_codon:yes stop_codon:yes gene_type:complete